MRTMYKNPGQRWQSEDETAGGRREEPKGGMSVWVPFNPFESLTEMLI